MSKYLFLVNPVAGGGKALSFVKDIEDEMRNRGLDYKLLTTTRPYEATEMVEANQDYDFCVAVGGDGTVNEVARGILNRGSGVLGIISGGTGNDLGKSLSIEHNHLAALRVLIEGRIKEIDLGRVEGRYFFNIASLGFDAEVVRHTDQIKKFVKGKTSYILGVLTALVVYRKRKIIINIDGVSYEKYATLAAVGNGKYYGGGMKILPMAELDDKILNICIIKDISNLRILTLFPTIFKGDHIRYPKYVEFHQGNRIAVKIFGKSLLNIDGELINIEDKEVVFELAEKRLKVFS